MTFRGSRPGCSESWLSLGFVAGAEWRRAAERWADSMSGQSLTLPDIRTIITGKHSVAWIILALLVIAGSSLAVCRMVVGPQVRGVRAEQLIRLLERATPENEASTQIVLELGRRGESQIPAIMEAFKAAGGKTQLRIMLADSVSRIYPPTSASIAALEQMAELVKGTEAAEPIRAFLADCRAEYQAGGS